MSESDDHGLRREFKQALKENALRMEHTVVRAGLLLLLGGTVIAVTHSLLTFPHWGVLISAFQLLCWQTMAFAFLRMNVGLRVFAWLNPLVESLFPSALIFVETLTEGPRLGGLFSAAPIVYMYAIILSIVRLRPVVPIMSGTVGSVCYLALMQFMVLPRLAQVGPLTLDESTFLLVRGGFIFIGGMVGSFVVLAMRRVSGQAHREVRAQDLFGKYRMGEEIASGGMGVVLRATYCPEGGFARDVAMKRIHPHLVKDPALVNAFRSEAELSARMLHPNIVQVLDFGRVEDTWYYAMEYVDGFTLHAALKAATASGQTIPLPLLAYIGREVCAGLDYAHRGALGVDGKPLNVVHRDLTPSNVLLAKTGQVKIADFGVARALKGASVLQTQTVAGKLPYMAPEQASGGSLDARTDLFTLGIVLWESICGRMLFHRDNEAAILNAVLNIEIEKPSAVRPGVPPEWDAVVMKLLSRKPDERYSTAHELSDALGGLFPAGPAELSTFLSGLSISTGRELATPHAANPAPDAATKPSKTAVTQPHR